MTTRIDTATQRGSGEMEGFLLAVNQPMLRLAMRLGFSIARDGEDASVRRCQLQLGKP